MSHPHPLSLTHATTSPPTSSTHLSSHAPASGSSSSAPIAYEEIQDLVQKAQALSAAAASAANQEQFVRDPTITDGDVRDAKLFLLLRDSSVYKAKHRAQQQDQAKSSTTAVTDAPSWSSAYRNFSTTLAAATHPAQTVTSTGAISSTSGSSIPPPPPPESRQSLPFRPLTQVDNDLPSERQYAELFGNDPLREPVVIVICKRCQKSLLRTAFPAHWEKCEKQQLVTRVPTYINAPSPHQPAYSYSPSPEGPATPVGGAAAKGKKRKNAAAAAASDAASVDEDGATAGSGGVKKRKKLKPILAAIEDTVPEGDEVPEDSSLDEICGVSLISPPQDATRIPPPPVASQAGHATPDVCHNPLNCRLHTAAQKKAVSGRTMSFPYLLSRQNSMLKGAGLTVKKEKKPVVKKVTRHESDEESEGEGGTSSSAESSSEEDAMSLSRLVRRRSLKQESDENKPFKTVVTDRLVYAPNTHSKSLFQGINKLANFGVRSFSKTQRQNLAARCWNLAALFQTHLPSTQLGLPMQSTPYGVNPVSQYMTVEQRAREILQQQQQTKGKPHLAPPPMSRSGSSTSMTSGSGAGYPSAPPNSGKGAGGANAGPYVFPGSQVPSGPINSAPTNYTPEQIQHLIKLGRWSTKLNCEIAEIPPKKITKPRDTAKAKAAKAAKLQAEAAAAAAAASAGIGPMQPSASTSTPTSSNPPNINLNNLTPMNMLNSMNLLPFGNMGLIGGTGAASTSASSSAAATAAANAANMNMANNLAAMAGLGMMNLGLNMSSLMTPVNLSPIVPNTTTNNNMDTSTNIPMTPGTQSSNSKLNNNNSTPSGGAPKRSPPPPKLSNNSSNSTSSTSNPLLDPNLAPFLFAAAGGAGGNVPNFTAAQWESTMAALAAIAGAQSAPTNVGDLTPVTPGGLGAFNPANFFGGLGGNALSQSLLYNAALGGGLGGYPFTSPPILPPANTNSNRSGSNTGSGNSRTNSTAGAGGLDYAELAALMNATSGMMNTTASNRSTSTSGGNNPYRSFGTTPGPTSNTASKSAEPPTTSTNPYTNELFLATQRAAAANAAAASKLVPLPPPQPPTK